MGQKLWKIFACIGAPSRSAFYKLNKVDCTLFRQSEMDAFCTSLSSFLLGERGRENKLGNACLPGQPTASTYSFFCKDLLITWMDLMIKPVRSSLPYPNCTVTDRLFVLFKKNMKWSIFMDSSDRLIFIFIWVSCCWPSVWIHLEFS